MISENSPLAGVVAGVQFSSCMVRRLPDGERGPRFAAVGNCCPHRVFIDPTRDEALRLFIRSHEVIDLVPAPEASA